MGEDRKKGRKSTRLAHRMAGALAFGGFILASSALGQPSLQNQKSWSESQKERFLENLQEGEDLDEVQDDTVTIGEQIEREELGLHSNDYVSLQYSAQTFLLDKTEESFDLTQFRHGLTLAYGYPLLSWLRLISGLSWHTLQWPTDQQGGIHRFYQVGGRLMGEFALIPLGTPHTRYLLLRGGVHLTRMWDPKKETRQMHRFSQQTGWGLDAMTSLGYEWQLGGSFFRLHVLVDFYFPLAHPKFENSFATGMTGGVSYVF